MNILLTGGASGLGLALTRKLLQDPTHRIILTYHGSEHTALLLQNEFSNLSTVYCDFTDAKSVAALCAEIPSFELQGLIHNAFTGLTRKPFHKFDREVFTSGFTHNVLPVIQITQAVIKQFRAAKFGRIVTILTSYLINQPPLGLSEYVAAKAYLQSLSKSWAFENAALGITANTVSPSLMKTALTEEIDERVMEMLIEKHPLKKLLMPEEVADAVAYLLEASPHVNGANLVINASENL